MKWQRAIWIVSVIVGALLVCGVVQVARFMHVMNLETDQPNALAAFVSFVRRSDSLARSAGIPVERPELADSLEVYGLKQDEAWQGPIGMVGCRPYILVRYREAEFTDRKSDRIAVWGVIAQDAPGKDPQLQLGEKSFPLTCPGASDPKEWFSVETAERAVAEFGSSSGVARPDQYFPRVWKGEAGRHAVPVVSPEPSLQADYFRDGSWAGTVAFFASSEARDKATTIDSRR